MTDLDFSGSKIAVFCGSKLITYQRDDFDYIPFPGCWDLPGGGREQCETPEQCALRELQEEFELAIPEDRISWKRRYASTTPNGLDTYFLVTNIDENELASIQFGSEGQRWKLACIDWFLSDQNVVPHLVTRLEDYLSAQV